MYFFLKHGVEAVYVSTCSHSLSHYPEWGLHGNSRIESDGTS